MKVYMDFQGILMMNDKASSSVAFIEDAGASTDAVIHVYE